MLIFLVEFAVITKRSLAGSQEGEMMLEDLF